MNKDLNKMYREFCDRQEECATCSLRKTDCMLEFAYQQGKADNSEKLKSFVKYQLDHSKDEKIALAFCVVLGWIDEQLKGAEND